VLLALCIFVLVILVKKYNKRKLKKFNQDLSGATIYVEMKGKQSSKFNSQVNLEANSKGPLEGVTLGAAIGQGNFGRVFKGDWKGADVAVKRTKSKGMDSDNMKEVFVLQALNHPNIVRFLGTTEIDGDFCMVFEYVPKGDLGNLLRNERSSINYGHLVQM
jgi:serine/threonine protein kinase